MEVTKQNFESALNEIKSLLKKANFISFDLELSGLGRLMGERIHDLDLSNERYKKVMQRVKEYTVIQIGISVFRICEHSGKFLNATYCFYLSGHPDGSYLFDTSSMEFLARNDFNFNKLFREGLPFISINEEIKIREQMVEKINSDLDNCSGTPTKVRDEKVKKFVSSAIIRIQKAREEKQSIVVFDGKAMNPIYRKALFSHVAREFPSCYFEANFRSNWDVKVSIFDCLEEKRNYVERLYEEKISHKLGFTHLVKAILEAGKPLVGHNMFLDVMHFMHKFIAPLPDQFSEFRTSVAANLPLLYDTKLLAKDPPFCNEIMNTALESLYEEILNQFTPPSFETEPGHCSYDIRDSGQAHDGGYDAFMTGVIFATMVTRLEGRKLNKKDVSSSTILNGYKNKVNFMASYDIPYINLTSESADPDRRHIYHVLCPSSWSNSDVKHIFEGLKKYKTVWVKDTELFVIPQETIDINNPGRLLSNFKSVCPANVEISMYKPRVTRKKVYLDAENLDTSLSADRITIESPRLPKRNSDEIQTITDEPTDGFENKDSICMPKANLKRFKSNGSELLSSTSLTASELVESEMDHSTALRCCSSNCNETKESSSKFFTKPDQW